MFEMEGNVCYNSVMETKHAKPKKKKNIVLIILIIICIGVMLFAGYQIFGIMNEYSIGDKEYDSLSQLAGIDKQTISKIEESPEQAKMINMDFDELSKVNDEIVGWILSPGTVINYPIVQGENNSKYLNTTFDGTYNKNGCIFLNYNNAPDFTDRNSVIYGHRMNSGKMFASLLEYKNQEYYEAHREMYLYTPDQIYKLEVFSAYVDNVEGNYYQMSFEDEEDYLSFLNERVKKSLIKTEVELTKDDRIITMQTCTKGSQDERFIVHAKLTPME